MTPLELPATGASLQAFEPQRNDFISPEAGGRVASVSAGVPLWLGVWQLGKIGSALSDAWRAALLRQRGSQRLFVGRDRARLYPLAYAAGFGGMVRADGGVFNGSATAWSQTIDADGNALLTLAGQPAGLQLTFGDYCDFRWSDTGRALVRAVMPATADGSGQITVMVEPPVPTLVVPAGAVAHLDQPGCLMRLVPGEQDLGPIDRRLSVTGGKITGIQELRP